MRIVTQLHNHGNELLITHDIADPQFYAFGHSGPFKAEGPQVDLKIFKGRTSEQIVASNMTESQAFNLWFALTRALFGSETVAAIYDLAKDKDKTCKNLGL